MHPSTHNVFGHVHRTASEENGRLIRLFLQWISEVLHFCQGLPIILVGCKKDLRYDQKTIEELHKTSQKPVTPEQVSLSRGARETRSKAYCTVNVSRTLQPESAVCSIYQGRLD